MKKLWILPLLLIIGIARGQAPSIKMPTDTSKNDNQIYTAVQQQASFPGGLKAFGDYLTKNVKYPENAKKQNIKGYVFITFVVEKDGSLSNIKILRSVSSDIDAEATRVIAASPKWEPGRQNGQAKRTQFTVPIKFTLPAK
jgi:protein TonB